MNFLILGSTGYLGSKLINSLVENGNSVVGTIRENSDISRLENIQDKIRLIPADVAAIETSMQYEKYDWIINVAGNYGRSTKLYQSVLLSNIDFPLYILDLAAEKKVPNYMTISTGLPEEMNMYSFSKGIFARFGKFYSEKHDINFFNMKLQMFYGADEPLDRFLPQMVFKLIRGEDVNVTLGTQHRDIVSVEDVIGAVMAVINSNDKGYHDIEVGSGEAPTIKEILEYIKAECNSVSNINYGSIPMRRDEPDCIANLKQLNEYGYSIKYDWKSGLSKMIKEMKSDENSN
mgnify:CR=1 FL=1